MIMQKQVHSSSGLLIMSLVLTHKC